MKIEVLRKGKTYRVRPYYDISPAIKKSYESETDDFLKRLALIKLFKAILTDPLDWYSFDGLEHHEQLSLACDWLIKSNAMENMKEEPNVIY
jgi:hypothetical protein